MSEVEAGARRRQIVTVDTQTCVTVDISTYDDFDSSESPTDTKDIIPLKVQEEKELPFDTSAAGPGELLAHYLPL